LPKYDLTARTCQGLNLTLNRCALIRVVVAVIKPSVSRFQFVAYKVESVPSIILDVLQLSGSLAGGVKESRNDDPTRDLQMAAFHACTKNQSEPIICEMTGGLRFL
jgi:hypothetical protein